METPFSKTLATVGSLEGPETPNSADSMVRCPNQRHTISGLLAPSPYLHKACATGFPFKSHPITMRDPLCSAHACLFGGRAYGLGELQL